MTIWTILANICAAATLLFGVWVIAKPQFIADASHITFTSSRGQAEFRIAIGGFFAGMGLAALLLQSPDAFFVVGLSWVGGAVTRISSIVLDKPEVNASYLGFLASEVITATLLLLPWFLSR